MEKLLPDERYQGLAALIAAQRSGTHMLGAGVGSHPQAKYTGEVFCRRVPGSADQMWRIIDRVKCGGARMVLLDVKYNQVSSPVEELLRHIPVIHLIRRDDFRLYYSGALHTLRGNSDEHRDSKETPPLLPLVGRDFRNIMTYRDENAKRFAYLEDLRLYYEDLTGNRGIDRLPDWACEQICDVLGIERRVLTVGTIKEGPCSVDGLLLTKVLIN